MLRSTMIFLVLLRLAIGWHFFFEGWKKVDSYLNPSETKKTFSSEGYFREATGPIGPMMRSQLGDPDAALLARVTVDPASKQLPATLANELDDYTSRFINYYKLNTEPIWAEKEKATAKANQVKADILAWLTYTMPGNEAEREKGKDKLWQMMKRNSPDGRTNDVPMTMADRVAEYRAKLAEIKEIRERKQPLFSHDVDMAHLLKAKADAAQLRKEVADDLDKQIAKLRDGLNDILKEPLTHFALPPVPAGKDQLAFLFEEKSPFDSYWDLYLTQFEATYPLSDGQRKAAEEKLAAEKSRMAAWLANHQEEHKKKIDQIRATDTKEANGLFSSAAAFLAKAEMESSLLGELTAQTNQMKSAVNSVLTPDQAKGEPPVPEKKWLAFIPAMPFIHVVDLMTMWGLTIMGSCLLLGVLTRTNCVLAAGFLAMTYLAAPPFPWLPTAPNNEGFYLFVNKNLIELLALLVLATTASGRWFGFDAILYRFFHKEAKPKKLRGPLGRAA